VLGFIHAFHNHPRSWASYVYGSGEARRGDRSDGGSDRRMSLGQVASQVLDFTPVATCTLADMLLLSMDAPLADTNDTNKSRGFALLLAAVVQSPNNLYALLVHLSGVSAQRASRKLLQQLAKQTTAMQSLTCLRLPSMALY
jgi:hypothetical protein